FLTGNAYPPGTYLIATNGSRMMTFIDPSRKTFVEVNAASVASSIGARIVRPAGMIEAEVGAAFGNRDRSSSGLVLDVVQMTDHHLTNIRARQTRRLPRLRSF